MDNQPRIAVESADLRYVYGLLQRELEASLEEAAAAEQGEYSDQVKAEALAAARTELRKTFEMARYAVKVTDVRVETREQFRMYCEEHYGTEPLDMDLNEKVFNELAEIDLIMDDVAYQRSSIPAKVSDIFSESTAARLAQFDAGLAQEPQPQPDLDLPFERVAEISEDLAHASTQSHELRRQLIDLTAKMSDIQNGVSG